jgi:hypothetical protein
VYCAKHKTTAPQAKTNHHSKSELKSTPRHISSAIAEQSAASKQISNQNYSRKTKPQPLKKSSNTHKTDENM